MCTTEDEIKSRAKELGFTHVGIAKAEKFQKEGERLARWLARGYHASMEWMVRKFEKRIDPAAVLPGARSVISVAINYYTPHQHSDSVDAGKISRYAWGDDYHVLVRERLEQLLEFIKSGTTGIDGRVYVDTGPVLDKVWAQRAGLGWIGKHTNLITQDFGSWVFLGEILTTLELKEDGPATDHCGTCTRCIQECPTQAIVEPYVLNSELCISYVTIEHRGEVNPELIPQLDRWIVGCDVCQDVCPWNVKFARSTSEAAFAPRPGFVEPSLDKWSEMSSEEFSTKFKKSPIKRLKHSGLMRNIGVIRKNPEPTT